MTAAACSVDLKSEDRIAYSVAGEGGEIGGGFLAYYAVYDGHDGEDAAEYCREGMLGHLVREVNRRGEGEIEAKLKKAFEEADRSFAGYRSPFGADGATLGKTGSPRGPRGLLSSLSSCCGPLVGSPCASKRRGGTTATALLISPPLADSTFLTVRAVNTGDSRAVLSKEGGEYENFTEDHRPTTVRERARLRKEAEKGTVTVCEDSRKTVRL